MDWSPENTPELGGSGEGSKGSEEEVLRSSGSSRTPPPLPLGSADIYRDIYIYIYIFFFFDLFVYLRGCAHGRAAHAEARGELISFYVFKGCRQCLCKRKPATTPRRPPATPRERLSPDGPSCQAGDPSLVVA